MPCPYGGWVNGYLGRRLCPRYCHTLEYSIVTPVNIVLSRPRPREGKKTGLIGLVACLLPSPCLSGRRWPLEEAVNLLLVHLRGALPIATLAPEGVKRRRWIVQKTWTQYSTSTPSPLRGTPPVSGGESAGAEETVINIERHHPVCPMGHKKIPGHMDRVKYAAQTVAYRRCSNSSLFLIEWCNLHRA